jgi:hypothetical protein
MSYPRSIKLYHFLLILNWLHSPFKFYQEPEKPPGNQKTPNLRILHGQFRYFSVPFAQLRMFVKINEKFKEN